MTSRAKRHLGILMRKSIVGQGMVGAGLAIWIRLHWDFLQGNPVSVRLIMQRLLDWLLLLMVVEIIGLVGLALLVKVAQAVEGPPVNLDQDDVHRERTGRLVT